MQTTCLHFRLSIGIETGASEGAVAEIACPYGMGFIGILVRTALTGIFGFGTPVCSSKGSLPARFGGGKLCSLSLKRTADLTHEGCRR